jgi:hypothetical protein
VSFGELDRHQWRLLSRREEEEREGGEKEKTPERLNSAHRIHKAKGPTVRGTTRMGQVHIALPLFDLNLLLSTM